MKEGLSRQEEEPRARAAAKREAKAGEEKKGDGRKKVCRRKGGRDFNQHPQAKVICAKGEKQKTEHTHTEGAN